MASFSSHISPKTAVLVITTHGDFEAEVDASTGGLQPETVNPPDRMDVVVLQAATCGVVNILKPADVVRFVYNIRSNIEKFGFDDKTSKKDMVEIVTKIGSEIKGADSQPSDVAHEVSVKNPNYIEDGHTMEFHHHNDKSYVVSSKIIDKRFSRENTQTKDRSRDWKVNLLGATLGKDEDLMVTLNPTLSSLRKRERTEVIYMSDIIDELYKRGVRKILIFDFSCSVVSNDVSERDVRELRRNVNKPGGGNHKTKRKSKRKTKRKSRCIGKCKTRRH